MTTPTEREALIAELRMYAPNDITRKAADMLAADAQWDKLRDPAVLHANLLRGLPAQLTKAQLLHLLGTDAPDAQQVAVPQGWQFAPVEATKEMVDAGSRCGDVGLWAIYAAMLEVAPQPPQPEPRKPLTAEEVQIALGLERLPGPSVMVDVRKIEAALGIGRRKPLTNREIGLLWVDCVPDDIDTDPKKAAVQLLMAAVGLARAVEAALGIGAKP